METYNNTNTSFKICFDKALIILLPGHALELQVPVSVADPVHGLPPFDTGVATDLVRVLIPGPHVPEQVDHAPYAPHAQSTATTYENKYINNSNIKWKHIKILIMILILLVIFLSINLNKYYLVCSANVPPSY